MPNDERRRESSEDPAQKKNVPAPERGSPGADPDAVTDEAAKQIEKGKVKNKDVNPLAPPVNIQGGS
ncbi:MAG: hypothetical protein AB7E05_04250 [Sphingobium sp.]